MLISQPREQTLRWACQNFSEPKISNHIGQFGLKEIKLPKNNGPKISFFLTSEKMFCHVY